MASLREKVMERPRVEAFVTERGIWAWFLQRFTAALVFFFLVAHIWVLHYAVVGSQVRFDDVAQRLQTPLFQFLDITLLATAIYHSLNGIRGIVLDFGVKGVGERVLFWGLVVLGLAGFGFGLVALWPFIFGKPIL